MYQLLQIFLTDVAKLGVIMAGGMQIIQSFIKIAVAPITGTVFDKQPFKKESIIHGLDMHQQR